MQLRCLQSLQEPHFVATIWVPDQTWTIILYHFSYLLFCPNLSKAEFRDIPNVCITFKNIPDTI